MHAPLYIQSKFIQVRNQVLSANNNSISYSAPAEVKSLGSPGILNPHESERAQLEILGRNFIKQQNPIALVLFAGGFSARMAPLTSKQFIQIPAQSRTTTLFEIAVRRVVEIAKQNHNVCVYIVCSRLNSDEVVEQVGKLQLAMEQLRVYLCYQAEQPILDANGVAAVYRLQDERCTYPSGLGAFRRATVHYSSEEQYTMEYHIGQITKPELVYCFGVSNFNEVGVDYELLGCMVENKDKLDVMFRCCYSDTPKESLSYVGLRKNKNQHQAWVVLQYEAMKQLSRNNDDDVCKLPIWLDNFVFNPKLFESQNTLRIKNSNQASSLQYQFLRRLLVNKKQQSFNAIIAEQTISYAVMKSTDKCIGFAASRKQPQPFFIKKGYDLKLAETVPRLQVPSRMVKKSSSGFTEYRF